MEHNWGNNQQNHGNNQGHHQPEPWELFLQGFIDEIRMQQHQPQNQRIDENFERILEEIRHLYRPPVQQNLRWPQEQERQRMFMNLDFLPGQLYRLPLDENLGQNPEPGANQEHIQEQMQEHQPHDQEMGPNREQFQEEIRNLDRQQVPDVQGQINQNPDQHNLASPLARLLAQVNAHLLRNPALVAKDEQTREQVNQNLGQQHNVLEPAIPRIANVREALKYLDTNQQPLIQNGMELVNNLQVWFNANASKIPTLRQKQENWMFEHLLNFKPEDIRFMLAEARRRNLPDPDSWANFKYMSNPVQTRCRNFLQLDEIWKLGFINQCRKLPNFRVAKLSDFTRLEKYILEQVFNERKMNNNAPTNEELTKLFMTLAHRVSDWMTKREAEGN